MGPPTSNSSVNILVCVFSLSSFPASFRFVYIHYDLLADAVFYPASFISHHLTHMLSFSM